MKYWKYKANYGSNNVRDYILHYRDFKDIDELMSDICDKVFGNGSDLKDLERVIIITENKNKKYSYRAEITAHHASADEIKQMRDNNFRY